MCDNALFKLVRRLKEHLEEKHDLKLAEKAYRNYLADPVTISHADVKKELGL